MYLCMIRAENLVNRTPPYTIKLQVTLTQIHNLLDYFESYREFYMCSFQKLLFFRHHYAFSSPSSLLPSCHYIIVIITCHLIMALWRFGRVSFQLNEIDNLLDEVEELLPLLILDVRRLQIHLTQQQLVNYLTINLTFELDYGLYFHSKPITPFMF